jgi:phenylacetate-CoA ligase
VSTYCEATLRERLAFLKTSDTWTAAELEAYQRAQLHAVLRHAGATVPYYRDLFARLGFDPGGVEAVTALQRLPLLTKAMVKERHSDFVSTAADPASLTYMTTGGSTGDPLKVVMDRRFQSLNHANTFYYLDVFGYAPGTVASVRLHGNTIHAEVIAGGEFWVEEGRRLTMSVYHITSETCAAYVQRINAHRPRYIHAFPSAVALLCEYVERLGLNVTAELDCVFSDSETLYPWQRALIRRVLRCPVHNIYGHTEGAVMAFSCPHSDDLHVLPQVGVLELLGADGRLVTEPGEVGQIVVTGFNNLVFPLIRYATGDLGAWAAGDCACGRAYPRLARVEGRIQDYVVSRDGARVAIAPALFDYRFDWSNVDRFQVVQHAAGALTFRVVRAPAATESPAALRQRIISGFGEILGQQFQIDVQFVETILRTRRGKYRYVDQHLPIDA